MIDSSTDEQASKPNWPALLLVATELQHWVNTLPVWREDAWESWEEYSRRHGKREQELATRMRRMPGCTIARSTNGSATTLTLAGVEVRAQGGLAVACRDWIANARGAAQKAPRATG